MIHYIGFRFKRRWFFGGRLLPVGIPRRILRGLRVPHAIEGVVDDNDDEDATTVGGGLFLFDAGSRLLYPLV